MNYTEEELCTLVDQLPDIQYNLQMPVDYSQGTAPPIA